MHNKAVYQLVLAGVLCAIGLSVPLFMPKIVLGPMSFTLGSHVAIFLAMFISPKVALAVCLGTTLGFFLTTPIIIALRAASHIIFALLGSWILLGRPTIMDKPLSALGMNLFLGLIHSAAEVLVVTPFFINGSMFKPEQLANGYIMSVLVLVGLGTLVHSFVDCSLSLAVWKLVKSSLPSVALLQDYKEAK